MGRNEKKRRKEKKEKNSDSGIDIKEIITSVIKSKKVIKNIKYSINAKVGKVVADNLIKRPPRFECGL
ncbi:MAG: hypothetical protein ACRCZ0_09435 [Cetobacterium sp.]